MQPKVPDVVPYRSQRPPTLSAVARRSFHFAAVTTVLLGVILGLGWMLAGRVTGPQNADVQRLATVLILGGWGLVTVPFSIYGITVAISGWRDARDRQSRNGWQPVVAMTLHGLMVVGGVVAIMRAMAVIGRAY